jgi:hypothetical protein
MLGAPAVADDDEDSFEERIIKYLLGSVGVDTGNREGIDYRERSPLVLPPSAELPPPDSGPGATANASWPRDPDRRDKVAASSSRPSMLDPLWSEEPSSHRRMSPDELRKGSRAGASKVSRGNGSPSWDEIQGRPVTPDKLGYKGDIFGSVFGYKPEVTQFEGEPARTNLTQPPVGYQTPSSSQPYGISEKKGGPTWKIPTLFDRAEGPNK